MRNESVKKITVIAMLLALQVIAGAFFSIRLPIVSIGFAFLPLAMTGILYGPVWAGLSAVAADFLVAQTSGFAYFPPMAVTALLSGLTFGLFLYRRNLTAGRIIACVVAETVVCSLLVQTFCLTLLTGKAFLALFPARVVQNLITAPVMVVSIRAVAPFLFHLIEQGRVSISPVVAE